MSITKDIRISALPMAVGLVLSTAIAFQPASLPVFAQEAESAEEIETPQVGGVMAFGGGDMEIVGPAFAGVLAPQMGEAFAVGPGGEAHHHHGLSEANKLTDDQLEKLHAIHEDIADQAGLKHAQLRILHRKLRDCLSASSIDTKQAQDLAKQITNLKADMTQMHLDGMIKAAQVFTPEQRHEMHMMMLRHGGFHHHHHHGHHMWGHHGGPGGPGGPGGHGGGPFGGPSHEHHEEMGK